MTDRILVLGAGGDMGQSVVLDLAQSDAETVAADIDSQALADLAARYAVETTEIDVTAPSARETIRTGDFDVVINAVGPFQQFGPPIQKLVIEAGVDYVDLCDDAGAIEEQLAMHEDAAAAGVTCVVGCGASPGVMNLLAMHAASQLDECHTLDLDWVVPVEDAEGNAVVEHLLHGVTGDYPQVVDGRLVDVPAGTMRRTTQFPRLDRVPTVTTGHPEPITLIDHVDATDITLRGGVLPAYQMRLVVALARLGLTATPKRRQRLTPLVKRFKQLDTRLRSTERRPSALRVEAKSDSETVVYGAVGHMGPVTGVPASVAANLLATNEFDAGVYPPEAVFDPVEFLSAVGERSIEFFEWRDAGWNPGTEFS